MAKNKNNLPTVAELTKDTALARKNDEFNLLMNQEPPEKWVKRHPYIKNYNYIPIDKIELMLKRIFKRHRIEVTGQGDSFNGVWVTVRVHYQHPVTGEWDYHDGIGATELQTKKGKTPADMANINPGALGMAYPTAKSRAVKNACQEFGKLFGSDLNRDDTVAYSTDPNLDKKELNDEQYQELKEKVREGEMSSYKAIDHYQLDPNQMVELQQIDQSKNGKQKV